MSTDNITCSLSRLALAKAIKTPDNGEEDSEPWNKSIIFHQSHIPQRMRESIQNPQMYRHQQKRRHPQPQPNNRYQQQQRHRNYLSDEPRSSVRLGNQKPRSNHSARSSLSSQEQLAQIQPPVVVNPAGKTRRYIPSDDEEDEEDGSGSDSSSEASEPTTTPVPARSEPIRSEPIRPPSVRPQPAQPQPVQPLIKKTESRHIPQPSDDEDDDDDDDDEQEEDEEDDASRKSVQPSSSAQFTDFDHMNARRLSTLRQLERGPSLRQRSRSTSDMNNAIRSNPEETTQFLNGPVADEPIEQWRKTVLEAADAKSTPSSESNGSNHAPLTDSEETSFGHQIIPSDEYDLPSAPSASLQPGQPLQNRRLTMSDMDIMYYQLQQQQQMQMQYQQAQQMAQIQQSQQMAQIQQSQQMAQIQQYQQAMQVAMQQQPVLRAQPLPTQQRKANSNANRMSMSGMDMLLQREQEKAELLRKPKRVNPSNAQVEGLLAKLPEQGLHNISFQQMQAGIKPTPRTMTRATKSDFNISTIANQRSQSPNPGSSARSANVMQSENLKGGGHRMKNIDARRRAEMLRNESSGPSPSPSSSTPVGQQQPIMTAPMHGQYLTPNMGMGMPMMPMPMMGQMTMGMPMMGPSRSAGGGRPASMMSMGRQSNNNWNNGMLG
ncbi:hypothetical protein DFQ28_004337 [Apophysomyces sp. BC1034]|nr:hypothetical protein DFQ30_004428 [Apophysomyces sp. BC1015]KAG0188798.1 hypothetical protein DFQ28_004337 [Apophysomyces sp. BC1034]